MPIRPQPQADTVAGLWTRALGLMLRHFGDSWPKNVVMTTINWWREQADRELPGLLTTAAWNSLTIPIAVDKRERIPVLELVQLLERAKKAMGSTKWTRLAKSRATPLMVDIPDYPTPEPKPTPQPTPTPAPLPAPTPTPTPSPAPTPTPPSRGKISGAIMAFLALIAFLGFSKKKGK